MSRVKILLMALLTTAATVQIHAADKRYPLDSARKIEIITPSSATAWENKNFLDCNDVVLTEEDVRYALRHMRKVPEKSYFDEYAERTGCLGGARVTFKNGKTIAIGIEPTGRINTFELNAKLKPTSGPETYYECQPCKARKMGLLKDALNRADERRLRKAEAEGVIPPGEAERRLKAARAGR